MLILWVVEEECGKILLDSELKWMSLVHYVLVFLLIEMIRDFLCFGFPLSLRN